MATMNLNTNYLLGIPWLRVTQYRLRMGLIMLCADLLGFGSAAGFILFLNSQLSLFMFQWNDLWYAIIFFFCLAFYSRTKLYPGIGLNPAEEIRLVVSDTLSGFLLGSFVFAVNRNFWHPNLLALIPFAFLSIFFVLLLRWWFRIVSVKLGVWGAPVVVVGSNKEANRLARYMLSRRRLGFIPSYMITDQNDDVDITVPVLRLCPNDLLTCPNDYFYSRQIFTAFISDAGDIRNTPIFPRLVELFPRLIFVSDVSGLRSASMQVHDLEGIMGVEVKKKVLNPLDTFIKRVMDIIFSFILLILSSPIWLLTMLLIRLDSPGPIFFTQQRVSRKWDQSEPVDGNTGQVHMIRVLKFRTMVMDAEQTLQAYLQANPQARVEWEQTQKLKHDPRITRVGKWIRMFSVDEIPQFLNVLKGEMSLVGPRPMMIDQIKQYGKDIEVYTSVRPGITGLWQVSGRNNTTFQERAAFDKYYVHNWSVWLDIYILLRTVWVVISRDGAY